MAATTTYPKLPPDATYWVRTPEGKWLSVTAEEAQFLYGTPKGAYGKIPKRGRRKRPVEAAVLGVMPYGYLSASDAERGLAIPVWDWGIGAVKCSEIEYRIWQIVGQSVERAEASGRKAPTSTFAFVRLFHTLCPDHRGAYFRRNGRSPRRTRKSPPKIGKGQKRNQRSVLGAALRKDK